MSEEAPPPIPYKNPQTSFFHVFFKVAAVAVYVVCGIFSDNFVVNFVVVIILLAVDFWTVKNVSGRKLVGLRYWNEVTEEGKSEWRFESLDAEGMKQLDSREKRIFWWSLYLMPLVWLLLGFIAILKLELDYLLIIVVALVMHISNIIGYTKCSKEAKTRIKELAKTSVQHGVKAMFAL